MQFSFKSEDGFSMLCIADADVYAVGDVHGQFERLMYNIKASDIRDSVIIIAGDIGLGFNSSKYMELMYESKMKKVLEERNVLIIGVRGNHDKPCLFNDDEQRVQYPRFIAVPDYTLVKVDNGKGSNVVWALLVGGAISIDRTYRMKSAELEMELYYRYGHTPRESYWIDEPPVYDEEKLSDILGVLEKEKAKIDCVITHTCPTFCFPTTKSSIEGWLKADPELENDLDKERDTMENLYDALISNNQTLERWVYGHFHDSHVDFINDTKFVLLSNIERKFDCEIVARNL